MHLFETQTPIFAICASLETQQDPRLDLQFGGASKCYYLFIKS